MTLTQSPVRWLAIVLIAAAYTCPAFCMDPHKNDPERIEIDWALSNIFTNNGIIFGGLRAILFSLGSTVDALWQKLLGGAQPADPTVQFNARIDSDLANLVASAQPPAAGRQPDSGNRFAGLDVEEELDAIGEQFKHLYVFSKQALEENTGKLTVIEQTTLSIIQKYAGTTMKFDAIAGGGGVAFLWWLYRLNPPAIMSRAARPKNPHGRFLVPTALSLTSSLVGPLLKPAACLIVGAYGWHKLKKSIIEPYKAAHASEIEKFKRMQMEHQAQVREALEKETERNNAAAKRVYDAVTQASQHIGAIEKDVDDKLDAIYDKFREERERLVKENEALKKSLEQQAQMIKQDEQVRNENLRAELKAEQDRLTQQLLEFSGTMRADLTLVQKDVKEGKQVTAQLKDKVGLTMPKLEAIVTAMGQIKQNSDRQLAYIKGQPGASTSHASAVAAGPADNKDKGKPADAGKKWGLF